MSMSISMHRRSLALCALFALSLIAGCATPPAQPQATDAAPPVAVVERPIAVEKVPPPDAAASEPAAAPAEDAAVPVPVDPLRPEVQVDLNDEAARADLWARVRRGFAMPNIDNDRVRDREQWYASRPDYVQRMTERGGRYLFHIVEELERRGMPTELALLPFIESAFNPQAMSSAKASGMWQFMPGTGRDFALKQNVFRDDRRDVLASTRAALDYLGKLYTMFGDWHLALAAYNWGEGSVQRAIARNQRAGLPTDYSSLRMPRETQYYVPKLQAVKNIVLHPEAYSLSLPPLLNHPYFLSVPITRDIDVELAAKFAGIPIDEFKFLNPQMNKPVILAAGTPQLLLPYDNANAFVQQMSSHRGAMASWTAWIAPKTVRPVDAARQVGMSEAQLREVNRIPPRMLVRAGSTLLVPRAAHRLTDVSEHIAENAMMTLTPDQPALRRVSFKAGRKDSVASIAKRYRIGAVQVAQWNNVDVSARFKPGQHVLVYLANPQTRGRPTRHASITRKAAPPMTRSASNKSTQRVAKTDKAPARTVAGE